MSRHAEQRTARRNAEAAERKPRGGDLAAEHVRAVLAAALDPIVAIDTRGMILSASDSVRRVFGWNPDELVGRNVSTLIAEPVSSSHDRHLAEYARTGLTHILGTPRQFDEGGLRKDGSQFPIEVCVSRADIQETDGTSRAIFVGILRDISERRRAEQTLRIREERVRLAMRAAGAGVWDWDLTADAAWWSPEMYELWGVEPGTRVTRARSLACVHEDDRERVCGLVQDSIDRCAEYQAEFRIRHPHRGERWMHSHARVERDGSRAPSRMLGFTIDITNRKVAEEELRRHESRLEQLVVERTEALRRSQEQVRLADRMASIGTLAAGLGHDMNNVLLPVRAHLNSALAAAKPPCESCVRHAVTQVQKSVDYLQQLADGLHFLAADPDRDNGGGPGEGTDLDRWWAQAGPLLSKSVPKHVRVESFDGSGRVAGQAGGEGLPRVDIAPHRLTQAVLNLIVNAGQAIPAPGTPGGHAGVVRISAEPILAQDLHGLREMVRLGVHDNGTGMTDEVKRQAFELFFTTKPRGMGTGLGLSLVARIVNNAGGTAHIDTVLGKGTSVYLDLPVQASPARVPLGETDEPSLRLAVISIDDGRTAGLIRQMLEATGMCVEECGEPGEAALWVTTPGRASLKAAAGWISLNQPGSARIKPTKKKPQRPPRSLVLVGPVPPAERDAWQALGAVVVERADDFLALRDAIRQAATLSAGAQP